MTRNEQQLYSDVTSIRESLQKIANALETNVPTTPKPKDIPGFEGTLDALDNLTSDFHKQGNFYTYEHELDKNGDNSVVEYKEGIINDSDHEIRKNACFYESILNTKGDNDYPEDLRTKKDCILDYITGEFGVLGARYTDIIKFSYYLGEPNAPKYDNSNRGYYACAFNTRFGGHLIKGGKDQLVKGINKEGNERYFAHSFVDQATDYYRRIR